MTSLAIQAEAVERSAVNLRGHIDNLRELPRRAHELPVYEHHLRDLEAAARTMRWLAGLPVDKQDTLLRQVGAG